MSLYDDATLICLAKGAAGKDGVLYNIKPEEKLKPTELITEGGFENNNVDSNWSVSLGATGALSVSNNEAVFSGASGDNSVLFQNGVLEVGKTYKVSLTIDIREGGVKIGTGGDGQSNAISDGGIYTQGKHNHSFYHTVVDTAGNDDRFIISRATSPYDFTVDNVSVKEVEQKPLDFTFTRGSNLTATRVAPSGYIEKGRENLITYSNDFSEWGVNTGVYNAPTTGHTGYDGSTNAWLINRISTSVSYVGIPNSPLLSYSGVFTWSIYAKNKSGVNNGILLYTEAGEASFDLTGNGSLISETSTIDTNIESIGSGWFRCSFTASGTINADADGRPRFMVVDTAGSGALGEIYIQNAQLEAGLVATDYIDSKSTTGKAGILEDEPRFDYTGGGCPTWLGEPGRVNLLQYSEYVDGWNQNTADVALSPDASPEGVKNAYRVSGNGTGTQAGISVSVTSGEDYTGSIWIKKVSGASTAKILDTNNTSTTINITTEWQRFEITAESTSTTGRMYVQLASNSSDNEMDIYGAQLEEGSYSTSYIPNHGTSGGATRAVEQADVSNLQSNGIITDTQGTFFIDVPDYSTSAVQWDVLSSDFYFSLRAAFFVSNVSVYERILNTQSTIRTISPSDVARLGTTTRRKLALSWNGTSLITSINGTSFDDTIDSTLASQLDKIRRANWTTTKVSTDQILMFDKQLTKEELNELTSIS